jgi:sec-independent protein translocase protein TatC
VQIRSLLPKVSEYLSADHDADLLLRPRLPAAGGDDADGARRYPDSKTLADKRKYAIVIAFVVAAVLTPPDPISQIGLALPTILLYEISIWTGR